MDTEPVHSDLDELLVSDGWLGRGREINLFVNILDAITVHPAGLCLTRL